MLEDCSTIEDVELLETSCPEIDAELFKARKEKIKNGK